MKRHGVNDIDIGRRLAPGSFEIPLVAKKLAETKNTMLSSASGQSSRRDAAF